MNYNKNVVEEALFQIRNLEETLQENAKGILQSTMSEEIKQLVKESLREQDEIEEPVDDEEMDPEMEMDDEDMEMDDEDMEMDDEDMAMDDEDMAMDDEDMAMDPEMEMDPEMDDETIDMTDASDAEVLRVFKAMGDDDGIVIKKEGGNINLKDGDNEYMIQLGESYGNNRDQLIYEIEMGDDGEMGGMSSTKGDFYEQGDYGNSDEDRNEGAWWLEEDEMNPETMEQGDYGNSDEDRNDGAWWLEEDRMDYEDDDEDDDKMGFETPVRDAIRSHKGRFETPVRDAIRSRGNRFSDMDDEMEIDFEPRGRNRFSDMDGEEETSYEIEIDPEMEEEYTEGMDYTDTTVDGVMEAVKKSLKSLKSKGTENRRGPKFSYDKKPNMGGGFNEKRKEAFGKGIKATGTGKPKFEYKESMNTEKGPIGDNTRTSPKPMKKVETKEAARTYGNGSKDGSRGLRKAKTNNRNYEYSPFKISENYSNNEVSLLREKNEEYKAALDVFRTKLNEVAVFNSNLAYATRLFTEHSTTKQEKINILRRFDNLESLKESKNLYRTIKGELSSNGSTGEQKINESIQRTVNKTADTGSSVNLIESKTYENPQFLRMKDLMTKIK
jgi:hypothetical protein